MKHQKVITVLLVDDDKNVLQSLHRHLRSEPYRILFSQSAENALEILSKQEIAVIVTDQKMGGLKGLELLSILRDRYPNTVRIMLTGHASLPAALQAINSGEVFRYLTKPADPVDVLVAIREAIAKHESLSDIEHLLELAEMQHSYIDELEKEHPGISEVEFDDTGAIIIKDL